MMTALLKDLIDVPKTEQKRRAGYLCMGERFADEIGILSESMDTTMTHKTGNKSCCKVYNMIC